MEQRVYDLQIKMALTHEFADYYVRQDIIGAETFEKETITKLVKLGGYVKFVARQLVGNAKSEAVCHVTMHQQVNPDGMGRNSNWLDLYLTQVVNPN